MYFYIAFFVVSFAVALISSRILCGYSDVSRSVKIGCFFLLWVAWLIPICLEMVRHKMFFVGAPYAVAIQTGYFLFGAAFILFVLLVGRDVLWGIAYGVAKVFGKASPEWSPLNVVMLAKANRVTVILAVILSFYALYQGVKKPSIREIEIVSPKIDREISILQINDMHIDRSKPVKWFREMVTLANAQDADLIVLPGDIVDDKAEAVLPHLAELAHLKSRYGVYFSPGNHEFYNGIVEIQWQMRHLGIIWLSGNGKNIDGLPLYLAGVPDIPSARQTAGYEQILDNADENNYKILLAHNPVWAAEYLKRGFDLQLSAHTHGGQIFPFHLPVKYASHYLAGLYDLPDGKLYVSRGAGYWGPPMRLLAPSDMTLIRLKPAVTESIQ